MSKEIEVKIGKKNYRLQTETDQENRVKHVAELWDGYVEQLIANAPNMERDRLVVLAGMLMADEFLTIKQEKETQAQSTEAFHNNLAERLERLLSA